MITINQNYVQEGPKTGTNHNRTGYTLQDPTDSEFQPQKNLYDGSFSCIMRVSFFLFSFTLLFSYCLFVVPFPRRQVPNRHPFDCGGRICNQDRLHLVERRNEAAAVQDELSMQSRNGRAFRVPGALA